MAEALDFFRTYELWIYGLLALGGLFYIRKFLLAWGDLREAAFGLERESAQSRLNQSASMVFLLIMMAAAEFALVSFVAPTFPGANPLLTPTLDLLATATSTLPAEAAEPGAAAGMDIAPTSTPEPVGVGCVPGQIMIDEPIDGSEISDVVTVRGTANIPNFGFYKYEIARPEETVWLTILAGREVKVNGELGQWDTRTFPTGDYQLRLVVTDNQGQSIEPCVIRVRVDNPLTP
jgi:hypothetical protein